MNDAVVNKLLLLLALAGLAVLGWGYWLATRGREKEHRRLRQTLLLALGLLGALGYPNFGLLHFGNFIHVWDTYHYYVGAKYFPELGYERLYECTALADHESGLQAQVVARSMTNLRTNLLEGTREILAHPERCKSAFGPARWEEFKHDVGWFRQRVSPGRWEMIQHDHGYNATPVWNLAGHLLTSISPASRVQVTLLALLDPLLLLAMAGLIYWAFGWRVLAVALLVFGTDFPNRYFWTGGAFLRHDWLFFSVAFVCLLRKERWFLAGGAIAYATTLRLFPGLLLVGPVLAAVDLLRTHKRLDPRYGRLFAGAAIGAVVLVAASLPVSGGLDAFRRFAQNTAKHSETPLTNHMGLRTVLSYRPSTVGAVIRDDTASDPWAAFKDARLRSFHQARPLFVLGLLASCALLFFAVRGAGHQPWVAAALSTGMIAVGAELTCYYYCFVIIAALLVEKRREVALLLLTFTALTQLIAWAPLPNMTPFDDEKYVTMSVAALIAFGFLLWIFTREGERRCLAPEADSAGAGSGRGRSEKKRRR